MITDRNHSPPALEEGESFGAELLQDIGGDDRWSRRAPPNTVRPGVYGANVLKGVYG